MTFRIQLTKGISGNHLLRVDGFRDAKSVLCTNTETVLFARSQLGHSKTGFGAGSRHSDPVALTDVALLDNVVSNVAATILLWRVPEQRTSVNVQFCDFQRSFRWSRDVCTRRISHW